MSKALLVAKTHSSAALAGFDYLDQHNRRELAPTLKEVALLGGSCMLTRTTILETPPSVRSADRVLTNPTHIEYEKVVVNGETVMLPTTWVREERRYRHLGTTRARKYAICTNRQGQPYLSEFAEAAELPGEDPRRRNRIRMPGHLGVHEGEMVITTEALVSPDDPEKATQIQPVVWWAPKQTPKKMEEVARGQVGTKNLNAFPRYRWRDDVKLGVVGRPHPTLSYFEVADPTQITPEAVASAEPIPGLLPTDSPIPYHLGGNYAEEVAPGVVRVDTHRAWSEYLPEGRVPHYELSGLGIYLAGSAPQVVRAVHLGVTARRGQFPAMPAKPQEGGVFDFYDVTFGAIGPNGHTTIGLSDNYIGYGIVTRY